MAGHLTAMARPVYFPRLDILRFAAAFTIVLYHAYDAWVRQGLGYPGVISAGTYSKLSWWGEIADRFIMNLYIGVDLFFLISGFLITYILLAEKETFGKIGFGSFFVRRILRIWPVYYLIVIATYFIFSWRGTSHPDYLPTVLFWNNFHAIATESWQYPFAHFWSICIEEHFYLVWPFIIAFVPVRALPMVFALLIFGTMVFRTHAILTLDHAWMTIFVHTFSRCDMLIIGSWLGLAHFHKPFTKFPPLNLRIMIYAAFMLLMCFDGLANFDNFMFAVFRKYLYAAALAFGMINYTFNPDALLAPSRQTIFHYFGKVSYGIYMYGNLVLGFILARLMETTSLLSFSVFILLSMAAAIVIPVLSYELMERPILKLKSRFARIRTREVMQADPTPTSHSSS